MNYNFDKVFRPHLNRSATLDIIRLIDSKDAQVCISNTTISIKVKQNEKYFLGIRLDNSRNQLMLSVQRFADFKHFIHWTDLKMRDTTQGFHFILLLNGCISPVFLSCPVLREVSRWSTSLTAFYMMTLNNKM